MKIAQRQPTESQAASAAESARGMIKRDFGALNDLPRELQDTVAYIYYSTCVYMQYEDFGGFAKGVSGMLDMSEEIAFNTVTIKMLPKFIQSFRELAKEGKKQDIEYLLEVYILMFKYRIPDVGKNSLLTARLRSMFYRKHARKVPDGFYSRLMRSED